MAIDILMANAPKKILFAINNLSAGGAERLVVDQTTLLSSWGYDVRLATLRKSMGRNFDELITLPGSHVTRFHFKYLLDVPRFVRLVMFLRSERPDCIISNLYFTNTLTRLAALFVHPRPLVITYEHNVYEAEKNGIELFVDRILAHVSDRVIAVSEAVKDYLIHVGVAPAKISVIVNGVDLKRFSHLMPRDAKRRELGFAASDFLLVAAGNIHPRKGHDVLLKAFAEIAPRLVNCHVLVCGSDKSHHAEDLKQNVSKEGLSGRFMFLGSRPDILDIINASDVFVMPSRYEGLGIALLEAMALGKPIVATDIPAFAALVTNGREALIVQAEDAGALAQKILDLHSDALLRSQLGLNAAERARQFSIDSNAERLLQVLGAASGQQYVCPPRGVEANCEGNNER